jgi:hypothetical protein
LLFVVASPAFGQAGLTRSQSNAVTGAIQNQIRQAVRPRLVVRNQVGPVTSLALSAGGGVLAIVYNKNAVRMWDLQNGVEQARYTSNDPIRVIRVSSDGQRAVLGTEGGNVVVVTAANGSLAASLRGHQGPVTAIDISRDGSFVASAGSDGTIRLWDLRAGREASSARSQPDTDAVAITADGRRVVAGAARGGVLLWNTTPNAAPITLNSTSPGIVAVGFGEAGRIIAMGSDGTIHVWDSNNPAAPARSFRAAAQVRSAELSEGARAAAVSDSDTHTEVVDLDSGRVLREFASSPGSSRFIMVDLARQRLITGGGDGIVRILNLNSGTTLAQIISTVNGWAALDAQGRFDGTPGGVQDVQWLAAQLSLPVDNFSEAYFEPGLVGKYMRDQPSFVAPAPTAVEAGIYLPPRVSISAPPGSYAAGGEVDVTVTAQDQGGGVGTIRLFQNGKLVPSERQTGERREGSSVIRSYRLALVSGSNRLTAVAANQQQIDGEAARAEVAASGRPSLPNLDIVSIGINRYRDGRFDLDYGTPDALAILNRLDQSSSGVFARAVALQLTDEAATRAKIIEVLMSLQRYAPEDVLVVYLAGHGEIVGNEWYLLPQDVVFSQGGIAQTGISASMLRDMLARAGPQRILVMIDSCKSGGAADALATSIDRRVLRSIGRDTGVAILAAARRDQNAAEIPRLGHGAFTYVVLEGLGGGRVTADGLLSYSVLRLPSLTKSLADYMQIPVAYTRGDDFQIAR